MSWMDLDLPHTAVTAVLFTTVFKEGKRDAQIQFVEANITPDVEKWGQDTVLCVKELLQLLMTPLTKGRERRSTSPVIFLVKRILSHTEICIVVRRKRDVIITDIFANEVFDVRNLVNHDQGREYHTATSVVIFAANLVVFFAKLPVIVVRKCMAQKTHNVKVVNSVEKLILRYEAGGVMLRYHQCTPQFVIELIGSDTVWARVLFFDFAFQILVKAVCHLLGASRRYWGRGGELVPHASECLRTKRHLPLQYSWSAFICILWWYICSRRGVIPEGILPHLLLPRGAEP